MGEPMMNNVISCYIATPIIPQIQTKTPKSATFGSQNVFGSARVPEFSVCKLRQPKGADFGVLV